MPPKSNSHSSGRRFEFTEPRVNWDIPSELLDPPFSYHWEQYPSFISRLIHDAGVPPPASAEAGPSTRSTSTVLPQLQVPMEQVVAALAAAYSAGQKSNQYKFQETDYKIEELYDCLRIANDTRVELQSLRKSCELSDKSHENLANGVISIKERHDAEILEIKAELQRLKAKRAKDKEKIKALEAEQDKTKQEKAAITAQLELVVQGVEALNGAMVTTQQHIEEMAMEIEALGEEQQEPEEDNNALADPAEEPEGMDVEEQEEIIDP